MPSDRIVLDTSVISNFFLADALESLLQERLGRFLVTVSVWREVLAWLKQAETVIPFVESGRILLVDLYGWEELRTFADLRKPLDAGESATLAYAIHHDCVAAIDDKAARKLVLREEITVQLTGTIGLLRDMVNRGMIDGEKAKSLLKTMMDKGYRSPIQPENLMGETE